jgi:hypothetical protein
MSDNDDKAEAYRLKYNAYKRDFYSKNRDRIVSNRRAYYKVHRKEILDYVSSYFKKYPGRRRAINMVSWAIATLKLIPAPCETCGKKAEAHHDDYSKPLEVRWLCRKHHRMWHANNFPIDVK